MEIQNDVHVESSPVLEVPRDGAAYAEWRQTGKLPEAKPSAEGSFEGVDASFDGSDKSSKNTAPASEAGNSQEKQKPQRDNAASRLNELLEDLRKAGLTPAELKSFKREAQQAQKQETVEQPKAAPEQTANPTGSKPPVKPKADDFQTYEAFEAAREKYFEELAEYNATKKFGEFQRQQAMEASQKAVAQKMEEARAHYKNDPEAVSTISSTARAIIGDQQIPLAVKSILDQSPVWTHVLYTLGGKSEDLQAFIQLSKQDPGAAIRKAVLIEHLVSEELAKGSKSTGQQPAGRDESGKFVSKAPEKQESDAPPPPREVSGRGTAPPDQVDSAVKKNDFRQFREAQNSKDMSRLRRR